MTQLYSKTYIKMYVLNTIFAAFSAFMVLLVFDIKLSIDGHFYFLVTFCMFLSVMVIFPFFYNSTCRGESVFSRGVLSLIIGPISAALGALMFCIYYIVESKDAFVWSDDVSLLFFIGTFVTAPFSIPLGFLVAKINYWAFDKEHEIQT